MFAALLGEFLERVASEGSGGDDVEGIDLGVEHGEAVVMLGGDDDIPHAGGFCESDDIVGTEAGGIEVFGEGFVVGDGDGEIVHDPLADVGGALTVPLPGRDRVEAPVDEHAEACIAPPLHACIALGRGLFILDGGNRMVDRLGDRCAAFELRVAERCGGKEKGGGDAAEGSVQGCPSVVFRCRGIVCEK